MSTIKLLTRKGENLTIIHSSRHVCWCWCWVRTSFSYATLCAPNRIHFTFLVEPFCHECVSWREVLNFHFNVVSGKIFLQRFKLLATFDIKKSFSFKMFLLTIFRKYFPSLEGLTWLLLLCTTQHYNFFLIFYTFSCS